MVAGSHARKLLHRPFSTIFLRYVFLKVSRPRCRGRWPGTAGVGDAAPVPRMIPACRSRTPRPLTAGRPVVQSACPPVECPGFNGGESRTGSSDCVTNGRPPGDGAEQASNTARGTLVWRTCGTNKRFDKPRCREASRPVGPFGPLASCAPSVGGGRQETRTTGLLGASTKNTGDGAWACRTSCEPS